MITNGGKTTIKRFFARQVGQIAGSLALGVGAQAATLSDTKLHFEVVRVPITSVSADMDNNRLVFKTQIAPGLINTAYEIGIFSSAVESSNFKALSLFGAGSTWVNGTLDATNARAGSTALKIDYVANGTTNAEFTGVAEDLSSFRDNDSFAVAFHAGANLSSVRVRMGTNSSNYYEYVIASPTAGYNIYRANRSTATITGTPSWDNISYIAVRPSATAGGAGSIWFEGIRFEDNALDSTSLLVARSVLATPKVIDPDINTDIEYSLGINIT